MKFIFLILHLFPFSKELSNTSNTDKSEYIISNGQMMYGDTDVNLAYEDAILRSGNDIIHFPPSQIEKVAVIDETTGDVELYHSGSFGLNNRQYLFQILSEGKTTLLYREGLKFSDYEETEYPAFFILIDKQVYSLSNDKKEMIKQLDHDFQKDVSTYIKTHKLNLSDQKDMTKFFDYYNLLILE